MDNRDHVLVEGCAAFGIALTEKQREQFSAYYELLLTWNSFMNLTAITEYDEVMSKHFADSLALVKAVPDLGEKPRRVIDVGTGAGFPGIPLKIVFPNLEVVLLDSLNKRVKFLNEVIEKLGFSGITAVHARAEDGARMAQYRESFDLAVSRAVANLASLSEYCLPYVDKGGQFISYKSGSVDKEAAEAEKAIHLCGGETREIVRFSLDAMDRSFVVIQKVKQTPKRFPRKAGLPGKDPLK